MLKSMTGFGKASCELPGKKISVEIKAINSKQLDLILRLPGVYKTKESELRTLLMQKLVRGKIELIIAVDQSGSAENYSINRQLVKKYFADVKMLADELNVPVGEYAFSSLLKMPDVLKPQEQEPDENEWEQIFPAVEDAVGQCDHYRIAEGAKLEKDFINRIALILKFLDNISPFETQRIEKMKERFRKDLSDVVNTRMIDENRFEQEIIYYLEKIDITEEKVRLKNNCDYFLQTLAEDESNGKKLNFISQEIGREINTIGSKANDSDIQKLVVQMKDELEKIKEQLYNIL
jgi:uncharacterized protein (TIGR00255 family)